MRIFTDELTAPSLEESVSGFDLRETPLGEYLGAKVSEGFDYTTTGRFMDERRIRQAEEEAYGRDTRPAVDSYDMAFADPEAQANLTKTDRPIMSKLDWEKSEHFRQGIQYEKAGEMTPVRAQILAEDFDKRRYRDSLIERSPTGFRSVLGFGAGMIGSLPDPVNLIGFGGVAAGRTLGKAALIGAAENVAATTLADAVVLPDLAARGEKVGFQEFVMDNMFAAALGGLFGLGGQALKNATSTARLRAHMPERQTLAGSLEKAVADVADGRPADVREVLRLEKEALGRLYDEALLHPLGGNPNDPQVRLAREGFADDLGRQIDGLLVDRGSGKLRPDGEITADTKYGLVKVIWKHGEESGKAPDLQVTKEDILRLPEVIREFVPAYDKQHGGMEWVVQREDGRQVIYAAREFVEDGVTHLVTVHVPGPGKEKAALSSRLNPVEAPGSPSELSRPIRDTAAGASNLTPSGAENLRAQAEKKITTDSGAVKGEVSLKPSPAKELWQMTRAEFVTHYREMELAARADSIKRYEAEIALLESGKAPANEMEAVYWGDRPARIAQLKEMIAEIKGRGEPDKNYDFFHKREVDKALKAGKDVPDAVRREYAPEKGEVTPHRAAVESAVAPFMENAPGAAPTRIINAKDIPPDKTAFAARLYPGQEIIHEGWFDHRTGEVVLVADHLTQQRAVEVWMHEQIGHHGLRKVFGDKSEMNLFLDAVAERYGHTGANARYMAEEEVAKIAEKMSFGSKLTEEERSIWSQLVEAVRAWLVRNGLAEVSDKDIHRVLQESLTQVRKGEEKPQAKPGVVQFGDPKPERFAEPKEVIQRAEQSPEISEQAMHAQIEAMREKGQLRGVDHFEMQEAGAATERAERYGEHLLNIAECAAKVVG
jgi:hypothetical protein